MAIGAFDLFVTPDHLVIHNALDYVFDAEDLPTSAVHILIAEPFTSSISKMFSSFEQSLELAYQEIPDVEEFIRAGPLESDTMLAPPHWSLLSLVTYLDLFHGSKIHKMSSVNPHSSIFFYFLINSKRRVDESFVISSL